MKKSDHQPPAAAHRPRVLVLTGAGISAESGIPTFRGAGGYWRSLNARDLATQEAFDRDPDLVWTWYRERRRLIRRVRPNAAHQQVVRLAHEARDFLLVTQNVDDLHTRAEFAGTKLRDDQVVQIHGDIFVTRCAKCGYSRRDLESDIDAVPSCPRCGAHLRPGVVWFDEELDPAQVRRIDAFLAVGACDVVLVVGTTASFDYIADWISRGSGSTGTTIEINPDVTALSPSLDRHVREPATTGVTLVVDELLPSSSHDC